MRLQKAEKAGSFTKKFKGLLNPPENSTWVSLWGSVVKPFLTGFLKGLWGHTPPKQWEFIHPLPWPKQEVFDGPHVDFVFWAMLGEGPKNKKS